MISRLLKRSSLAILAICILSSISTSSTSASPQGLLYPVVGNTNYSDTFYAPRSNGTHLAIDIFAPKHAQLVSAVDGYISYVGYPQDSWGWYIQITDDDGYRYDYIHINNDTPGTDDGSGGAMNAYAPDMKRGNRVVRGQHLGYVGDSGNAETTPPHLHFEITEPQPSETRVNPFTYLNAAAHVSSPTVYPAIGSEILPYGQRAGMQVSLAMGNIDADQPLEFAFGAGRGGGPHVKLYDSNRSFTNKEFNAFDPYFTGGIDVAMGDVTGDGIAEIIAGPSRGGGPHVKVFDINGVELSGFNAYNPYFAGGIKVSAGDVDGDGKAEIITGIEGSGGPHVKIFKYTGELVSEFNAFDPYFTGGIDVAAGDVVTGGAAKDEIVVSAGPGGGPHVKVFDMNGTMLRSFYAYGTNYTGGVRVSVGEVNSGNAGMEIATVPWRWGGSHVRVVKGDGSAIRDILYLEQWWEGDYDIAAGNGNVNVGTGGNRRTSVRQAF